MADGAQQPGQPQQLSGTRPYPGQPGYGKGAQMPDPNQVMNAIQQPQQQPQYQPYQPQQQQQQMGPGQAPTTTPIMRPQGQPYTQAGPARRDLLPITLQQGLAGLTRK